MVIMTPDTAGNTIKKYLESALQDLGKFTWPVAVSEAANYTHGIFSDWRLPSREELRYMYENRNRFGCFTPDHYWSSSQTRTGLAWNRNFVNGHETNSNEFYMLRVRLVRAFS